MSSPGYFRLNPDEAIVPDFGLGGLRIHTHLLEIQKSIAEGVAYRTVRYEMADIFEARYYVDQDKIAIGVDIRNGRVFRLSAMAGYTGLLFGKIAVGMQMADAYALVPDLYYNAAEGVVACHDSGRQGESIAGLAIDVGEDDPIPRLVPSMNIHAISVYIAELFSMEGLNGTW